MKLRTEAPVNGGRNYNGPKVNDLASLSKTELYAGNSSYSRSVLAVENDSSQNLTDKGTIRGEGSNHGEPSETSRSATSSKVRGAMGRRICRWRRLFLRRNQSTPGDDRWLSGFA